MLLEITNEFSHLFSDQDILSRELLLYYSYSFSSFLPNYGAKIELPLFFFFLYATFFDIRCFFMHQQFSLFHRLTFYWFESLSLPIFQIFKISLNYSLSEKLIYFLKNHFLIQF